VSSLRSLCGRRAKDGHMARALPRLVTQVGPKALVANLPKHLVDGRGRQPLSGSKDPNPTLLLKRRGGLNGAKSQPFGGTFQLERVARSKLQPIAQRLGQDDASSVVESDFSNHDGILRRFLPTCEWQSTPVSDDKDACVFTRAPDKGGAGGAPRDARAWSGHRIRIVRFGCSHKAHQ